MPRKERYSHEYTSDRQPKIAQIEFFLSSLRFVNLPPIYVSMAFHITFMNRVFIPLYGSLKRLSHLTSWQILCGKYEENFLSMAHPLSLYPLLVTAQLVDSMVDKGHITKVSELKSERIAEIMLWLLPNHFSKLLFWLSCINYA